MYGVGYEGCSEEFVHSVALTHISVMCPWEQFTSSRLIEEPFALRNDSIKCLSSITEIIRR
jgi:hypothetical protein